MKKSADESAAEKIVFAAKPVTLSPCLKIIAITITNENKEELTRLSRIDRVVCFSFSQHYISAMFFSIPKNLLFITVFFIP